MKEMFNEKLIYESATDAKRAVFGTITVSCAALDDVEGIYRVAASVGKGSDDSTKGFLMDDYTKTPGHHKKRIAEWINKIPFMYTAKKNKEIIGFLMAYTKEQWLRDNPGWVKTTTWKPGFKNYVSEDFVVVDKTAIKAGETAKGIGSRLYKELLKDLQACGISHIFAETLIDPVPNFASLAFRKKQAYKLVGTRYELYNETLYTDLIYYKPVNSLDKTLSQCIINAKQDFEHSN